MNLDFPREARVRTRAEFDLIFSAGKRTASPLLALHVMAHERPASLGFAVSRKVDRRAVGRNRIKRALRELFRTLRPQLKPGMYLFVARVAASGSTNTHLRADALALLQRAGALPPATHDGTIATASLLSPSPNPTSDRSDA